MAVNVLITIRSAWILKKKKRPILTPRLTQRSQIMMKERESFPSPQRIPRPRLKTHGCSNVFKIYLSWLVDVSLKAITSPHFQLRIQITGTWSYAFSPRVTQRHTGGNRGIAPLILTLRVHEGKRLSSCTSRFNYRTPPPVPNGQKAGWVKEQVRTVWIRKKILPLPGLELRIVAQSLHCRRSHPCSKRNG